MGELVVSEFVSVDGVFEDLGGAEGFEHGGWAFKFERGEEGDAFKLEELRAADAHLLGRVTYEAFAAAWPGRRDTGEYGEKMHSIPKYVVTSTLERADWNNSTIIRTGVAAEIAALKARYQGDILVAGSGQLARWLLDQDLVDELRVMTFPVVLGAGKRLFNGSSAPISLRLLDARKHGECLTTIYTRHGVA